MMGLICSPTAEGRSLSGSARPFPTTIWITAFRTRRGRRSSFSSGRRIRICAESCAPTRICRCHGTSEARKKPLSGKAIGYTGTMSSSASAWTRGAATCCRAKPSSGTMRWCCMRCRKIGLWKRSEGRARAPFSPPSRLAGRKIGGASVLQGDAQTAFRCLPRERRSPAP